MLVSNAHMVLGSSVCGDTPTTVWHPNRKTVTASIEKLNRLKLDWLPFAAQTMRLSADLNDYVLAPLGIVTADIPNRNLQGFGLDELTRFDPVGTGCCVWETFRAKPTFLNHDNQDPTKAKGIVLDVQFVHVPAYNVWRIMALTGWDRTKDPAVAKAIENKELYTYSMGAWVQTFVCSVCGRQDNGPTDSCQHMNPRGTIWGNRLAYQMCQDAVFFEISAVDQPAEATASGEVLDF